MERFRRKVDRLCAGLPGRRLPGEKPRRHVLRLPGCPPVCNRLRITSHGLALYLLEGADDRFGVACLGGECFGDAGSGFLRLQLRRARRPHRPGGRVPPAQTRARDRVDRYLAANPHHALREPYPTG